MMVTCEEVGEVRLHRLAATGQLRGFVLSYLGQIDNRLPWAPADLVPRAAVVNYPTDFSAMRDEHIEALTNRGEQLTCLHIAQYVPSIWPQYSSLSGLLGETVA